jgi:ADP-ribose pyrophosphatase YjhB (NUDIX family)
VQGAVRETLEESAWRVDVTSLIGVYLWQPRDSRRAYLRFAFAAIAREHDAARTLDAGIVRALWMAPYEIRAQVARHRSPKVMRCIDDHLAGRRLPLDWIANIEESGNR